MAEKLTRKEKIAQQKKIGNVSSKQVEKLEKNNRSLRRILALFVAVVGFFLYSNTFNHEYVLDDFGLIKDNTQTRQGISAIPEIFQKSYRYGMNITDYQLYRPLSKAMFAVEWQMSPDNPAVGHFMNVLWYAILCFVLFQVLCRYFNGNLIIPFLTALIFAAHPIHTEVVANIKSRDEIMCFLFLLLSVGSLHSYVTKNSKKAFIAGVICYFIALFAKESAITFLAIVPLMYYFFTSAESKKYYRTLGAMLFFTAIFLLIRKKILGDTVTLIPVEDNSLLAIKDFFLQRANAIYILGVYLKTLFLPTQLIADASYNHFEAVGFGSWKFLVPFVIFVSAGVYAIMRFKKKDPVSFAIIYFFVTISLVSNVIMLIGTNYGERLMFMPSLGICLLIAILLSRVFKAEVTSKLFTDIKSFVSEYSKPVLIVCGIVILFGYKTMARNGDWKDNLTLYTTEITKVPNSAHLLFYLANHITTEEYLNMQPDSASRMKIRDEALGYLTRALTIFPKYSDGYQRRGFIYNQIKRTDLAEADYKKALEFNHTHPIVYNNYGTLCFDQRRYSEALSHFKQAIRYNPTYAHALNNVASVYGVFGQSETELAQRDPANAAEHLRLAKENFETANSYFLRSINVDPEFAEPYRLMAITYRNLGNPDAATKYERLYNKVKADAKN
jgi:Tfp pilus assembly protein PilF/ABC-type transport system involved in multi-copper enzyme maturation permease subunit